MSYVHAIMCIKRTHQLVTMNRQDKISTNLKYFNNINIHFCLVL